jgi:Family of unknown function (DUF6000)
MVPVPEMSVDRDRYNEIVTETMDFVKPFYLPLVGAGITRKPKAEQEAFIHAASAVLPRVNTSVIDLLFEVGAAWRTALMGSWWAVALDASQYADRIGELLRGSLTTFAGQMHAFALCQFGTPTCIDALCSYLREYLPRTDLHYDQAWGYAALRWVDGVQGTSLAGEFTDKWDYWKTATSGVDKMSETRFGTLPIEYYDSNIAGLAALVREIGIRH